MKLDTTFLDLDVTAEITEEWAEWVSHDIVVYFNPSDDPDIKGIKVAEARITRCIIPYDEAGHDTWDRTQDLLDFHTEALTPANVEKLGLESALCNHITYIEKLEVMEGFKRKGLAHFVMQKVLTYLVPPFGVVGLCLPKDQRGSWLQKFYEFYGFERLGETGYMIKNCQLGCKASDQREIPA